MGVPTSLNFFVLLGLGLVFYYSFLVLGWSQPDCFGSAFLIVSDGIVCPDYLDHS